MKKISEALRVALAVVNLATAVWRFAKRAWSWWTHQRQVALQPA